MRRLQLAAYSSLVACLVFAGAAASQTTTELVTIRGGLFLVDLHEPIYPHSARVAAIQGDVDLIVYVSDNGTVDSVNVVSGHKLLKDAAIESAKASHFKCRGCNDGLYSYSLRYKFQIEPSDPEGYCRQRTNEVAIPSKLDSARHQVTVTTKEVWTCDPTVQIRGVRTRSMKCLYLWKCSVHPLD